LIIMHRCKRIKRKRYLVPLYHCVVEQERVSWVMENNKPTAEQIQALRTFAAANGRTWKSKLNEAWMSGRYNDYSGTERSDLLQQVRNNLGPSWLVRFILPDPQCKMAEFPRDRRPMESI
jgi:hypothetical protein